MSILTQQTEFLQLLRNEKDEKIRVWKLIIAITLYRANLGIINIKDYAENIKNKLNAASEESRSKKPYYCDLTDELLFITFDILLTKEKPAEFDDFLAGALEICPIIPAP